MAFDSFQLPMTLNSVRTDIVARQIKLLVRVISIYVVLNSAVCCIKIHGVSDRIVVLAEK